MKTKGRRQSTNINDLTGPKAHLSDPENFAQHIEDPAIGRSLQDSVRSSLPQGRGQDYQVQQKMQSGNRRRAGSELAIGTGRVFPPRKK